MADTNPFWAFSLAIYAEPDVARACLDLQEQQGVDVNLLLYGAWCALEGRSLARDDLAALAAATANWRDEVLLPIRGLRVGLRGREESHQCREFLQQAELEAERVQQQTLYELAPEATDHGTAAGELLEQHLATLADFYGLGEECLAELCAALAAGFRALKSAPPAG